MKNLKKITVFYCLAVLFMISCQQTSHDHKNEEAILIENNQELIELHHADQADRISTDSIPPLINRDPQLVRDRDVARRKRVYELLDANLVKTGKDYEHAAMIFQHGLDTTASSMAVKLMQQAVAIDTSVNRWLLAAAIDRDLMWRNKPQIFGTQYLVTTNNSLELYKIDTTQISDQERIRHGVPVLAELLNQKK